MKPPNNSEVKKYVYKVFDETFNKEIDKEKIVEKLGNLAKEMLISNRWRSACCIVAKKVARDNLALRKLVGELLNMY